MGGLARARRMRVSEGGATEGTGGFTAGTGTVRAGHPHEIVLVRSET